MTGTRVAVIGAVGPATVGVFARTSASLAAFPSRDLDECHGRVDALLPGQFSTAGSVLEALQTGEPISCVKAPPLLDHRYLHEDVGWGLVQWVHLASAAGVATPTMDALVALAGVLNRVDYRSGGLTLERIGLKGVAPDGIGR